MSKRFVAIPALVLAAACSSPTAPGASVSTNPQHKLEVVDACEVKFTVLGASARDGFLKVRNDSNCERLVGIAIYGPIDPYRPLTLDNQKLVFHESDISKPGQITELHVPVPACGPFQFDPYHSKQINGETGSRPDFGQGENLFDMSRFGGYFSDSNDWCPRPVPSPAPPAPPAPPTVPPVIDPRMPPTTPPVCPAVTWENWREYITDTSVTPDGPMDVSNFTVNVPLGCTVPLSAVTYQIRDCSTKFPQRFIQGSTVDGKAILYGPGRHTGQMPVRRAENNFQTDLRIDAFEPTHELTYGLEEAYYRHRTLAWRVDMVCLPEGYLRGR